MASKSPAYLPLRTIYRWEPLAEKLGVSEVARSDRGFMAAYEDANGRKDRLDPWWQNRRDNFVRRHMAQLTKHGEPLWKDGLPTRRHLALIMWAYSPTPSKL